MFKNKNKKRPTQHDAKEDDGQDQQQWKNRIKIIWMIFINCIEK